MSGYANEHNTHDNEQPKYRYHHTKLFAFHLEWFGLPTHLKSMLLLSVIESAEAVASSLRICFSEPVM